MNRMYSLVQVLLFGLIFSAVSITVDRVFVPTKVIAQQPSGPLEGITVFATSRKDTEKDESFMFVNSRTGDIWVYRNDEFKEHYRVVQMGQPLAKIGK